MNAVKPTSEAGHGVQPVTPDGTTGPPTGGPPASEPTGRISDDILRSAVFGNTIGKSESESESLTSSSSEQPTSVSKKRWRQPRNVREFAAMANAVATQVLNGEMDLDQARAFSSISRTVAQAMSIEVTRARFLKESPDLEFGDDIFEEEE